MKEALFGAAAVTLMMAACGGVGDQPQGVDEAAKPISEPSPAKRRPLLTAFDETLDPSGNQADIVQSNTFALFDGANFAPNLCSETWACFFADWFSFDADQDAQIFTSDSSGAFGKCVLGTHIEGEFSGWHFHLTDKRPGFAALVGYPQPDGLNKCIITGGNWSRKDCANFSGSCDAQRFVTRTVCENHHAEWGDWAEKCAEVTRDWAECMACEDSSIFRRTTIAGGMR